MTFSVVIITRDRPATLRRCLDCLLEQSFMPSEIILVDNSTQPETELLIKMHYRSVIRIGVSAPLGSQPLLRNIALARVTGEIVCFLDDDGFADRFWLQSTAELFGALHPAGMAGRVIQGRETSIDGVPQRTPFRFSPVFGALGNFNAVTSLPIEAEHAQGTNMAFSAEILRRIGGWDENLSGGYASFEEMDVCLRILRAGGRILYNPDAIVVHGVDPRAGGMPRELGSSVKYAYSYARNLAYVSLASAASPLTMIQAVLAAPAVNSARCLSVYHNGHRGPAVSWTRLAAAAASWAGMLRGAAMRGASASGAPRNTLNGREKSI
jgi:GT2 family glycosyltransferase